MSFLLRLAWRGAEGRGHEPEIFRFAFIFFAKQCLRELGYCAPISSSKSYLSPRLNAKADASQKSFEGFKLEKETFYERGENFIDNNLLDMFLHSRHTLFLPPFLSHTLTLTLSLSHSLTLSFSGSHLPLTYEFSS